MPARLLKLVPQFHLWVQQQVMTPDEAMELQTLFQALRTGEQKPIPEHLKPAMENLGLHQLVNEETATRH